MTDMGYPIHLIDLLAKLFRKQLTKVKVAGTLSEWFLVKKGVRQGCVLSPYMINILVEMVMRETLGGFQGGLQIRGRMVTNLGYADDIILLATLEADPRSWWMLNMYGERTQPDSVPDKELKSWWIA